MKYDGQELVGSPVTFMVIPDVSKVKLLSLTSATCPVGQEVVIKVCGIHVLRLHLFNNRNLTTLFDFCQCTFKSKDQIRTFFFSFIQCNTHIS